MEQLVARDDEIASSEHTGWRSRYRPNGNQDIGRCHYSGLVISRYQHRMRVVEAGIACENGDVVPLKLISNNLGLFLLHLGYPS